jgi:hypothetical protein
MDASTAFIVLSGLALLGVCALLVRYARHKPRVASLLAGLAGALLGAAEGFFIAFLGFEMCQEPGYDASAITAGMLVALFGGAPVGAVLGVLAGLQLLAAFRGSPARRRGARVGAVVGAVAAVTAAVFLLPRTWFLLPRYGEAPSGLNVLLNQGFWLLLGVLLVLGVTLGLVIGSHYEPAADRRLTPD